MIRLRIYLIFFVISILLHLKAYAQSVGLKSCQSLYQMQNFSTPSSDFSLHFRPSQNGLSVSPHREYSVDMLLQLQKIRTDSPEYNVPEVTKRLIALKQEASQLLIDSSLNRTAVEMSEVLVVRPYNKNLLNYLERGYATKPFELKVKSEKTGLAAGLIKVDESMYNLMLDLDYKAIPLRGYQGHAVVRNDKNGGKEIWTKELEKNDQAINVLADSDGNIFTSDIDLLVVGRKDTSLSEEPSFSKKFGYVTAHDVKTLKSINDAFQFFSPRKKNKRNLVNHGAEVYNPDTKGIDYPLQAYTPEGEIWLIQRGTDENPDSNWKDFVLMMEKRGYRFPVHAKWQIDN
jgi:hypothetical protein